MEEDTIIKKDEQPNEIEPFFSNSHYLLELRKQTIDELNKHSDILLNVQKYFTTIISALLSLSIGLLISVSRLGGIWVVVATVSLVCFSSYIICILGSVAHNNCAREYRNIMENHAVYMKINDLLGMYNEGQYVKLQGNCTGENGKPRLKLFGSDTIFGNKRWKDDADDIKNKYNEIDSRQFVEDMITNPEKHSAFYHYSLVFRKFIAAGIFIIGGVFLFLPLYILTYYEIIFDKGINISDNLLSIELFVLWALILWILACRFYTKAIDLSNLFNKNNNANNNPA